MYFRSLPLASWRRFLLPAVAFAMLVPQGISSTAPRDRLEEGWWKDRHEHAVRMSDYGRCDVAFLGDSITQGWETDGEKVWDREIAPFKAANFGFSGDRTEHVLWRLDNGELLPMRPKLVVLMIGTNNIYKGDSPEETVEGVRAILKTLTIDLPKTRILLLGIFPRAMNADDPLRQKVALANGLLKDCADGQHVRFLDIGAAFVREDGTLRTTMFPDLLHPNEAGYEIWAQAVTPAITEMLDDPTESPPPSIN